MCSLYNVIPNGYVLLDGLMNILYIILLLLPLSLLLPNTTIAEDNFTLQIDKTAHYTTSFGLYFMFYTLYSDSLLPMLSDSIPTSYHSILSATIVGFSYELYQATPQSKSDGFSIHDMTYNLLGVFSAKFLHEVFLYFREIL